MDENLIHLKELLTPTASNILDAGSVIRDSSHSLWYLAQDAFGWQNWLTEREIPFQGNALDLFDEAVEKLQVSEEEADTIARTADVNDAIPACVYKGNEADGNGDIVAWSHLFNLKPTSFSYCPPEIKDEVVSYTNQYRQRVPNPKCVSESPKQTTNQWQADGVPNTPSIDGRSQATRSQRQELIPIQRNSPIQAESLQSLDLTLARLGREIVDRIGEDQDDLRNVNGNVKYRIALNLTDNTLRIYAKDRGNDPILVDANGQIDHATSQVLPEDVQQFQQIVDRLRAYQPMEHKQIAQLEMG